MRLVGLRPHALHQSALRRPGSTFGTSRNANFEGSMKEGDHVRVLTKPVFIPSRTANPAPHPHAGKTGIITELLGVRVAIGQPRAMVKIDEGQEHAGNIMIVALEFLELV
jgi:hypothetical protein